MDVKVHAAYANPDSLTILEAKFLKFPEIQEVYYQRNLVKQLNSNVQKLGINYPGFKYSHVYYFCRSDKQYDPSLHLFQEIPHQFDATGRRNQVLYTVSICN